MDGINDGTDEIDSVDTLLGGFKKMELGEVDGSVDRVSVGSTDGTLLVCVDC